MLDPKLKSLKCCNKIFEHCYPSCENHLEYQIYIYIYLGYLEMWNLDSDFLKENLYL